jgi:hypothetical protein
LRKKKKSVSTRDIIHSPHPLSVPLSFLLSIYQQGNISDHDLLIKLRRVTEFFEQGYSVRVIIVPTGSQVRGFLFFYPFIFASLRDHQHSYPLFPPSLPPSFPPSLPLADEPPSPALAGAPGLYLGRLFA